MVVAHRTMMVVMAVRGVAMLQGEGIITETLMLIVAMVVSERPVILEQAMGEAEQEQGMDEQQLAVRGVCLVGEVVLVVEQIQLTKEQGVQAEEVK